MEIENSEEGSEDIDARNPQQVLTQLVKEVNYQKLWLLEVLPRQWIRPLEPYWNNINFFNLSDFLLHEYGTRIVLPYFNLIFHALYYCTVSNHEPWSLIENPPSECGTKLMKPKVVIIGQDPYPTFGHANGLAFGVNRGVEIPASLKNIFSELSKDPKVNFTYPSHGCLDSWAKQGVVLLNTVLTVRSGHINSHKSKGWEAITDGIIKVISERSKHVVFLLWGKDAEKKGTLIDAKKHKAFFAPHPSPNSAHLGFLKCGHFSKANEYLKQHNQIPINWNSLNEQE